jgi:hypothetical protein
LQEKGLGWIIDYVPPRGALQQIGGEPLNAEGSERIFRISMVADLTSATWR